MSDCNVEVDLTNIVHYTNRVYIPYYRDRNRYLVMYGGAGSGKSVFAAQKILYRIIREMPQRPHRFLIVRKVAKTLRNSAYSLFKEIELDWDLSGLFDYNKTDMTITCENGNQILFAGLDDTEKLKSITGISSVWVEEATELSPQDFMQLDLRLRGKTQFYKQIMLTFNPVSALHWLKSRFFDFQKPNVSVLKTTFEDNRFIDEEYKTVLKELEEKDPMYFRIYALGDWGVLGNLILTNWVAERLPGEKRFYDQVVYGMDFGFNHASAFLSVGIKDGELYIFDEIYERGLTNTDLIQAVKAKASSGERIVADSAEPDRIEEFRRSGMLVVPAKKGPDSVKAGIDFLRRHRIHVDSSRCPNTIAEIQTWKYKEDKDGNVLEEPVPFKDDAMAALRYATESLRNDNTIRSGRIDW